MGLAFATRMMQAGKALYLRGSGATTRWLASRWDRVSCRVVYRAPDPCRSPNPARHYSAGSWLHYSPLWSCWSSAIHLISPFAVSLRNFAWAYGDPSVMFLSRQTVPCTRPLDDTILLADQGGLAHGGSPGQADCSGYRYGQELASTARGAAASSALQFLSRLALRALPCLCLPRHMGKFQTWTCTSRHSLRTAPQGCDSRRPCLFASILAQQDELLNGTVASKDCNSQQQG